MAIPFLGDIERLITEHGSAAVLKERLALASDQYAALEKQLADSENSAKALESERRRLEVENVALKNDVATLKASLSERQGQRFDDVREQLLQLLSGQSNITNHQVAQAIGISPALATYHLEELFTLKFVSVQHTAGAAWAEATSEWSIAQPGRAYLFKHKLLR